MFILSHNLQYSSNKAAYFFFQHPIFDGAYTPDNPNFVVPTIEHELTAARPDIAAVMPEIKRSYDNSPVYHSWEHAVMVADMCMKIARDKGFDLNECQAAAFAGLLHDSFHYGAKDDRDNVALAMDFAERILNLTLFETDIKSKILNAIRSTTFDAKTMSFPIPPTSLLGTVLRDADLLNCTYGSWPMQVTRLGLELGRPDIYDMNGFTALMIENSAFNGAQKSLSDTDGRRFVQARLDKYVAGVRHVLMNCRFL
jgi:hypothetical protein